MNNNSDNLVQDIDVNESELDLLNEAIQEAHASNDKLAKVLEILNKMKRG